MNRPKYWFVCVCMKLCADVQGRECVHAHVHACVACVCVYVYDAVDGM